MYEFLQGSGNVHVLKTLLFFVNQVIEVSLRVDDFIIGIL